MAEWNYRWVCPHWEFFHYQEDAPDIPFPERNREGASTFLNLMNPRKHNVGVRVEFFDSHGNIDERFGLEGIVSGHGVWKYHVDTGGPNFPKPPPGVSVSAQGWFQVLASHRLHISVHVIASKYTARARAWGFGVPIYEWPFPTVIPGWIEQLVPAPFGPRMHQLVTDIVNVLVRSDTGTEPPPSGRPRVDARGLTVSEPGGDDRLEARGDKK